jgi:hypothetical protein
LIQVKDCGVRRIAGLGFLPGASIGDAVETVHPPDRGQAEALLQSKH